MVSKKTPDPFPGPSGRLGRPGPLGGDAAELSTALPAGPGSVTGDPLSALDCLRQRACSSRFCLCRRSSLVRCDPSPTMTCSCHLDRIHPMVEKATAACQNESKSRAQISSEQNWTYPLFHPLFSSCRRKRRNSQRP